MTAMSDLKNVTFDEIEVGATASMTRKLSMTDIDVLALVSGDVNPFYVDESAGARHHANSTEAAGAEALLAAVLGTRLPGPGMRIVHENLKFQRRVTVGDELTATVTVREKHERDAEVVFECRCVNGAGDELVSGTVAVEAPTERVTYTEVAPPELMLRRGDAFSDLFRACKAVPATRCAIVHPCDRDSLLGPIEAARRGLIDPVLIGSEDKIRSIAASERIALDRYLVVPTAHSHAAAEKAVEMARCGEVEALMKGSLHTDELMGAVVQSAAGLRTARRISHVFVLDVPSYPRLLIITDVAVNIAPKLKEKADIVQNAIDLAHMIGIESPKVAILAAVETVNPEMEATVDAAALCKMADRGQITGGVLDGPLAFDNAVSLQAAQTKKITSPVAGQADILVVPDLEAGNMLAKQLEYLAGAEGAGIVMGARVPIVLTSRADSVRTRVASAALMTLVANARRTAAPAAR